MKAEMINCKFLILIQNSHKYGFLRAQGGPKLPQGPQRGMGDGVGGALGPLVLPQPHQSHQTLFWLFREFSTKEKKKSPPPYFSLTNFTDNNAHNNEITLNSNPFPSKGTNKI